jgi:hypothetical protein
MSKPLTFGLQFYVQLAVFVGSVVGRYFAENNETLFVMFSCAAGVSLALLSWLSIRLFASWLNEYLK